MFHFSYLFKFLQLCNSGVDPLSYELQRVAVELLKCFSPFQVSIVRL